MQNETDGGLAAEKAKKPLKPVKKGGIYCAAHYCTNRVYNTKLPKHHYFSFPSDEKRCQRWIKNSRLTKLNKFSLYHINRCYRLCSQHFEDSQFTNSEKNRLNWNAIPTLFPLLNMPKFPNQEMNSLISQQKINIKEPGTSQEMEKNNTATENKHISTQAEKTMQELNSIQQTKKNTSHFIANTTVSLKSLLELPNAYRNSMLSTSYKNPTTTDMELDGVNSDKNPSNVADIGSKQVERGAVCVPILPKSDKDSDSMNDGTKSKEATVIVISNSNNERKMFKFKSILTLKSPPATTIEATSNPLNSTSKQNVHTEMLKPSVVFKTPYQAYKARFPSASRVSTPISRGPRCCVSNCRDIESKESATVGIFFHPIPKEDECIRSWIETLQPHVFEKLIPGKNIVCSRHFRPTDYMSTPQGPQLCFTAIPSVFKMREYVSRTESNQSTWPASPLNGVNSNNDQQNSTQQAVFNLFLSNTFKQPLAQPTTDPKLKNAPSASTSSANTASANTPSANTSSTSTPSPITNNDISNKVYIIKRARETKSLTELLGYKEDLNHRTRSKIRTPIKRRSLKPYCLKRVLDKTACNLIKLKEAQNREEEKRQFLESGHCHDANASKNVQFSCPSCLKYKTDAEINKEKIRTLNIVLRRERRRARVVDKTKEKLKELEDYQSFYLNKIELLEKEIATFGDHPNHLFISRDRKDLRKRMTPDRKEQQRFALTLYAHGPLAYDYLLSRGFSLPSKDIMRRWIAQEKKRQSAGENAPVKTHKKAARQENLETLDTSSQIDDENDEFIPNDEYFGDNDDTNMNNDEYTAQYDDNNMEYSNDDSMVRSASQQQNPTISQENNQNVVEINDFLQSVTNSLNVQNVRKNVAKNTQNVKKPTDKSSPMTNYEVKWM